MRIGKILGSRHDYAEETRMPSRRITADDVHRIVGRLEDEQLAAVLATRASLQELIEARQWLSADDVVASEAHRQMSGRVARIYEILSANDPEPDEV